MVTTSRPPVELRDDVWGTGDTRTGAQRIADERERQHDVLGFDSTHDDEHTGGEMGKAAACYLMGPAVAESLNLWPFEFDEFTPSAGGSDIDNRCRDLEKAGALIAAEIDRLLRLR